MYPYTYRIAFSELNAEAANAPWSLSRWGICSSTTQTQNQRRNCNFSADLTHARPHSHIGGACATLTMGEAAYPRLWNLTKRVAELLNITDPAHVLCEGNAYEHANKHAAIPWHGDGERGEPGFVVCVRAGEHALPMYFQKRRGVEVEGRTVIILNPGDLYIMPGETLGFAHSIAGHKGIRNIQHAVYNGGIPDKKPKKRPLGQD
jgi:hypothetical protein